MDKQNSTRAECRFKFLSQCEHYIIQIFLIAMSIYHLYAAYVRVPLDPYVHRSFHVLFAMSLTFLIKKSKKRRLLDYILVFLVFLTTGYVILNYDTIRIQAGLPTGFQAFYGLVLVLLIMESCRRTVGLALPILSVIFLGYALFGNYLPGAWGHPGFSVERIMGQLYLTPGGIWGTAIAASANIIAMFIIFGAFLRKIELEDLFNRVASILAGGTAGGPAQVAVVSSALLGTISGSAVSNVATTGSFTIPLMKRRGYTPEFAAAVEAAASTGGQIMPPIMGAGAFIMSEMLMTPYRNIVIAAIIPAILYFANIALSVHFQALRIGLGKHEHKREEGDKISVILLRRGHLLVPVATIVFFIMKGFSPARSALYSIISLFIVSMLSKETRLTLRKIIEALKEGAEETIGVASACACAGIVLGIIDMTGLGVKFSSLIIELSGGNLLIALILAMMGSIILGMGLPTAVAYVIAAITVAPALTKLGVLPLVAHMFVFYFSILGTITPPVCLSVYTAAGIASASWQKTANYAIKLALPGFIVPYFFVQNYALLMMGTIKDIIIVFITSLIGIYFLASGVMGYLLKPTSFVERIICISVAFLLLYPGFLSDLIGIAMGFFLIATRFTVTRRKIAKRIFTTHEKGDD